MDTERNGFRVSKGYRKPDDEGRGNLDTQRAAERYLRKGRIVIPIPAGEKNPNRPDWQKERPTVEDIPKR